MGDLKDNLEKTCEDRARRHLANAIAYSKELLSDEGAELAVDYRSDILGELCSAEHQLSLDKSLSSIVELLKGLRISFELNEYVPDHDMISELRRLWGLTLQAVPATTPVKSVAAMIKQAKQTYKAPPAQITPITGPSAFKQKLPEGLTVVPSIDVLILPGNNESELSGIHRMINNLLGVNQVFEGSLPTVTTEDVLVWPPHTGIIRSMAAGTKYPVYRSRAEGGVSWSSKPQVVNAATWRQIPDLEKIFAKEDLKWGFNTSPCVELINRTNKICCGTKGRFRHGAFFVIWSEMNWELLRAALNDNMEWKE